ncbi:MAG: threonine/serine dehydratase [Gemmatimonadales bacterium]
MEDLAAQVVEAERRIRPWVRETPLEAAPPLAAGAAGLHLKLENLQHTGSFKARGAFNRLLALSDAERARGVIAASTGNHGAAVAYAMSRLGVRGRVVVPSGADPSKVAAIRELGADVEVHGDDSAVAERHARAAARREGAVYLSPYNDPLVMAGQGTVGVELARQRPDLEAVYIALGGGGLLAGVAAYLKSLLPSVWIVGASPENSAVMIESIRAGRILDLPSAPTLSDGTAGGVEEDAVTFEPCRALADELVTVTEGEIAETMRAVHRAAGHRIEGAAAVAIAAAVRDAGFWDGRCAVAIVCGGNVADPTWRRVLGEPAAASHAAGGTAG